MSGGTIRMVASERYSVDGSGHVFKSGKFYGTAQALMRAGVVDRSDIHEPAMPARKDLLRVHAPEWIDRLLSFSLTEDDIKKAEFPVTREAVTAHLLACTGTAMACRFALVDGVGLHCGGGSHHAFRDHGEGFCLVNDIAFGIEKMISSGAAGRALVIDLDAHQGNGTASIFEGRKDVFTFSMHGRAIYPDIKGKSSLDVELEPGTGNADYLEALKKHMPELLSGDKPDIAVYLAGADCYEHDRLGGLKLTLNGLLERDRYVITSCARANVPVAIVLGGGYAEKPEDTVAVHFQTLRCGAEIIRELRR